MEVMRAKMADDGKMCVIRWHQAAHDFYRDAKIAVRLGRR